MLVKKYTTLTTSQKILTQLGAAMLLATGISACQHAPHSQAQTLYHIDKQQFCQDFLGKLNRKPLQATFTGCSAGFYENHHSVIANYRVSGKHAFDVQEHLHRLSGMPRMVKDCCLWESTNPSTGKLGGVIYDQGETYYVRMRSKELRLGWGLASDVESIPEFEVQVIYPLELNESQRRAHTQFPTAKNAAQ